MYKLENTKDEIVMIVDDNDNEIGEISRKEMVKIQFNSI